VTDRTRILYDSECRFCRWSLAWLLRWDRARRLEPLALGDPRATSLLDPMPEAERMGSWHLVGPGGSVASAGAAAPGLLRLLPGGAVLAALAERFPGAVERGYRAVARRRGALGRRLTDGAVARADAVIARRGSGVGGSEADLR
jgi:predicted DCC family thiol-disulfide oxidoreductase YuxK